jgi:simple sugar transport system permease protein
MEATATQSEVRVTTSTRQRVMGILFVLLGVGIWFLFSRGIEPGVTTTFGMTIGGRESIVPDIVVPSLATTNTLAILSVILGIIQIVKPGGFGRYTNWVLGAVSAMFIMAFLTWAAAGKSVNFVGLMNTTLLKAVPLTLGAMSGILCERSGVVNIAIEGMMLMGAMVAALVASVTDSLLIGLLAAVMASAVLGLVHGVLSIKYRTDQIISGTAINIFSIGMTSYISAKFLQVYQLELNTPGVFQPIAIPLLSDIPVIGPILFNQNIFVYALYILLVLLHWGLYYTRWGLRLRSVGEHPRAADTLGINVFRTRYMAVLLGSMVAGLGGAYFTIGSVGGFDEVMTAGRGFISLAAMIFGNWNPFGSLGAGLLFGFADSLAARLAILGARIPSEFLLMAPYIATMVVLAGVVGRSRMPAADGTPYVKEGG